MQDAGVFTDAQSTVILYQNADLPPVPDSMSAFSDFEAIFDVPLFSAPSASRINIAKVNIEGIGAPSPLPHCAFLPGYVWLPLPVLGGVPWR